MLWLNDMYQPPYNINEIKNNYPDIAEKLLNDPVHLWRAESGIELIHKELTIQEQKRIWYNWQQMTDEMKRKSDEKSMELFGESNTKYNDKIMREWGKV